MVLDSRGPILSCWFLGVEKTGLAGDGSGGLFVSLMKCGVE